MLEPAILWKYLGVFLALIAAGFGFPIPEEIPIITAGGLVAGSPKVHWWIMIPVCIVGVVLADTTLYTIGRFGGRRLMKNGWVQRRVIPPEKRQRIERNFNEYGIGILLVARLLPGIRTPIFIMAGVIKLPWWKFILADAIYAIPGVNLIFWLSYFFTDRFIALFDRFEEIRTDLIILLILAAVIGVAIYFIFFHRHVSTGDPSEIPLGGKRFESWMHHHQHPQDRPCAEGNETEPEGKETPPDGAADESPERPDPPPEAGEQTDAEGEDKRPEGEASNDPEKPIPPPENGKHGTGNHP